MGSLVVKLDETTSDRLQNMYHYSDVDMLTYRGENLPGSGRTTLLETPIVYDVEAVKASIRNILMWRVGESVLSPEFGHNIHRSMYSQMTNFNKNEICQEIQRAIEENEPRAQLQTVDVKPDDDEESNVLHVRVVYTVVGNKAEGATFAVQTDINGK